MLQHAADSLPQRPRPPGGRFNSRQQDTNKGQSPHLDHQSSDHSSVAMQAMRKVSSETASGKRLPLAELQDNEAVDLPSQSLGQPSRPCSASPPVSPPNPSKRRFNYPHLDTVFTPDPPSYASDRTHLVDKDEADHAWLGNLERDELEHLLIEATRKIREREQKLMVAANIGKALLEKNLTLRSGIMSSMASSSSLVGLSDIEAMIGEFASPVEGSSGAAASDGSLTPNAPLNSPPTTDIDLQSHADLTPEASNSDVTPIAPHPASSDAPFDYFSNQPTSYSAVGSPSEPRSFAASSSSRPSPFHHQWIPNDSGLIASQPCSPSASIASFASRQSGLYYAEADGQRHALSMRSKDGSRHRSRPSLLQLQALENQRQLAVLGEQNEVLHQHISELQTEAETARLEGSKKLSRLNKEMRGLKAELEAAIRRNIELETSATNSRPASAVRPPPRLLTRPDRLDTPSSPLLVKSRPVPSSIQFKEARQNEDFETEETPMMIPSTSNLEAMVESVQHSSGAETALLSQLLAKIRELEETNAAMAKAEEDFGSRMGRAMEEDERLRDAYKAVEHSTVSQDYASDHSLPDRKSFAMDHADGQEVSQILTTDTITARSYFGGYMTPSHSDGNLSQISLKASPTSLCSSPARNRRAPGNRHAIEHRKTIRAAVRKAKRELPSSIHGHDRVEDCHSQVISRSSTEASLGTYSVDLSADSSAASSPRRKGLAHRASSGSMGLGATGRPRIRITPSIEDLGRRRKAQEEIVGGPHESVNGSDWQDVQSPTSPVSAHHGTLKPSDALLWSAKRIRETTHAGDAAAQAGDKHRNTHKTSSTPLKHTRPGDAASFLSPSMFSPSPTMVRRVYRSRSRSSSFTSDRPVHMDFDPFNIRVDESPGGFDASFRWTGALPQPATDRSATKKGRTLGSELGSIFGGDDRKHDFDDDLPQNRRDLVSSSRSEVGMTLWRPDSRGSSVVSGSPGRRLTGPVLFDSDRPTGNFGRLVPKNEAEHDDDLECVLAQSVCSQVENIVLSNSPLRHRDAMLIARVQAEEEGEWFGHEQAIEKGGLQDRDEPRGAQFDLIGAAVHHQAVMWADDDDYGKMISEREAIKLGLLEGKPSASNAVTVSGRTNGTLRNGKQRSGFFDLPWTRSKGDRYESRPAVAVASKAKLELESSEQVARRSHLEALLRRRRADLLRERGYDPEWIDDLDGEEELAATFAFSPLRVKERTRRAWAARESGLGYPSTEEWVKEVATVVRRSRRDSNTSIVKSESMDALPEAGEGEFEVLECPSWKKQGGRGTDYFPTSFRARYHPTMLKQRAAVATQMTYGWLEEWIQFAFVVFLAFMVTVEQGPNRMARTTRSQAPVNAGLLERRK